MSYSIDFRTRAVEYYHEGHSLSGTARIFGIAVNTIKTWAKKYEEEGSLAPKELNRPFKKIDPDALAAYVEKHPDAYQKEMAEVFNCSPSGIRKALKRLRITRKKRRAGIPSKTPKR